jgi:hypothetical protein
MTRTDDLSELKRLAEFNAKHGATVTWHERIDGAAILSLIARLEIAEARMKEFDGNDMETLARAFAKFAPDLAAELQKRMADKDKALDDFLSVLRAPDDESRTALGDTNG